MQQVAVCVVNFDDIEAGLDSATDGRCPGLFERFDFWEGHFLGAWRSQSYRGWRRGL